MNDEWGKPSRTNRRQKRKWRRKKSLLTSPRAAFKNIPVPAHVGAGCENPLHSLALKRLSAGAFSLPAAFLWRLGRGRFTPGRFPVSRFLTLVQAVTNSGVRTVVAAPITHTGAIK